MGRGRLRRAGTVKAATRRVRTQQQGALKNVAKPIELTRVFPAGGVAKATSAWRAIRG